MAPAFFKLRYVFVKFPASTAVSTATPPGVKNAFEPFIAIPPPQSKFPFNVVNPDTFKDDIHVVIPFNLVMPDTFNDELHVEALFKVVEPETFNVDMHVDAPFNFVEPETFNALKLV